MKVMCGVMSGRALPLPTSFNRFEKLYQSYQASSQALLRLQWWAIVSLLALLQLLVRDNINGFTEQVF